MISGIFQEKDTEVIFCYFPAWEMFFSMHVLSNAKHHVSREKWARLKEQDFPELVKKIRELSEITDSWDLIIDCEKWKDIRQMEIIEMITFFRKKNIYQWNEWIKNPSGKQMTIEERDRVIDVITDYYETIYRKEEIILRPYILRILQREKEKCQKEGLWSWCGGIHPRLQIRQDEIVYRKSREYRFQREDIRTVYASVSTFLHPHLWMYGSLGELEMVKGIQTEQAGNMIPEDLVNIFKALGDSTRLQIVKLLLQGTNTTQALAQTLRISEAAVSRHLKLMWQTGMLSKTRKGTYIVYEFNLEMIDQIPTSFYEVMMSGKGNRYE